MHEIGHARGIGWADDAHLRMALEEAEDELPVDPDSTPMDLAIQFSSDWDSADDLPKHGFEVYSGNEDSGRLGGVDPTPEAVLIDDETAISWSIMSTQIQDSRSFEETDGAHSNADVPIFLFSIEELSTIEFEDIPSETEE